MLSDVSLTSVAYVGPKLRTERPRKTKIGSEVAYVTRDSDTTFKVTRPLYSPTNASGSCSGERGNVLAVGTYCYVAVCVVGSAARALRRPQREEGREHIVAAARLQLVFIH